MYCHQRSQYIRLNSKRNSFRGNYSLKYGVLNSFFFPNIARKFLNNSWSHQRKTSRELQKMQDYRKFTFLSCLRLKIRIVGHFRTYTSPKNEIISSSLCQMYRLLEAGALKLTCFQSSSSFWSAVHSKNISSNHAIWTAKNPKVSYAWFSGPAY